MGWDSSNFSSINYTRDGKNSIVEPIDVDKRVDLRGTDVCSCTFPHLILGRPEIVP